VFGKGITGALVDRFERVVSETMLRHHAEELDVARLGGGFELPKKLFA
jgi:hypothetical protein